MRSLDVSQIKSEACIFFVYHISLILSNLNMFPAFPMPITLQGEVIPPILAKLSGFYPSFKTTRGQSCQINVSCACGFNFILPIGGFSGYADYHLLALSAK